MTVLDRVRELIERMAPKPICDDCITRELELSVRQHANHKTRELAQLSGFDRQKQLCALCNDDKLSIRRLSQG